MYVAFVNLGKRELFSSSGIYDLNNKSFLRKQMHRKEKSYYDDYS